MTSSPPVEHNAGLDLVQVYSNLPDHVETPPLPPRSAPVARPIRPERPPKQAQKRLDAAGVANLVAAYEAGGRVTKLATQFGIHRDTVHNILKRQGVLRPPGIQPDDLPEVIRLYDSGWSTARLAAEFDVSPSTVNRALRKADAPIRRLGPPRARSGS